MSDLYGVSRRRMVAEAWFWLVVAIGTVLAILLLIFGIRWVTAGPKGALQAREQIQSGASRITAYNHFFDMCAAVQATEGVLAASYAELEGATGEDRDRVRTNITGLLAQRSRTVAQYNADARKGYTIGQFRASDLPYELPVDYAKGARTSCVA